jgi:hypothetical protein
MEDFAPITSSFLREVSQIKKRKKQKEDSYELAKWVRSEILATAEEGKTYYVIEYAKICKELHFIEPYLTENGILTGALEYLQRWFPDCSFRPLEYHGEYFSISWI